MNIPNILTVIRIVLAFVFFRAMGVPGFAAKMYATVIFFIASITDFLDGYYARKFHLITSFGKIMDPIADKVLTIGAFCIFVHLGVMPWWMCVVIMAREIGITVLRLWVMGKGEVLAAERMGKYKTTAQMIAISYTLFFFVCSEIRSLLPWFDGFYAYWRVVVTLCLWGAMLLTVVSGIMFLKNNGRVWHVR